MNENNTTGFPAVLQLIEKNCFVIGGGKVASRKVQLLLKAGAKVTVVSPNCVFGVSQLIHEGTIQLIESEYKPSYINGADLVIAATNFPEVNAEVLTDCHKQGILVSSVDAQWREGSFITPASFYHEDLMISISSNGKNFRKSKATRAAIQNALIQNNRNSKYEIPEDVAILVVSHGSRYKDINQQFVDLVKNFSLYFDSGPIEPAFLELTDPTIPQVVEKLCKQHKVSKLICLTFFLAKGFHWAESIPEEIEIGLKNVGQEDLTYEVLEPLGDQPAMMNLMLDAISRKL